MINNKNKNDKSENLKRKIDIDNIENIYKKKRKSKNVSAFKQFPQNTINLSKSKKI